MITADSQAEVKSSKFGETVANNIAGNPEPSRSDSSGQACVETGRRVCIKCGSEIPQTRYSNAKYCSKRCANANNAYNWALRHNKFEKPGTGSGGNQEGENNHRFKTGIGTYSQRAFKHYGRKCNRCGSTKNMLVHHKDEDRSNNTLINLEVLCKACHQNHHCKRDSSGKYIKGQSKPKR